jgi:hypothetical protein
VSVLIATTSISVLRRAADGDDTEAGAWVDPYDEEQGITSSTYLPVVTGVRADISAPSGSQSRLPSGPETTVDAFLIADVCGLQAEDVVLDERTGLRYAISWCVNYDSPGHLISSSQAALHRTGVGD